MIQLLLVVIYMSFISLGLPDSMLGSAWPSMYGELGVPVSYAGIISMLISACTVVSSLLSERLTKWLGTGKITAISVAMTAIAMFGFSLSDSYIQLCLWAIPYGIGAGSVDAALNNYVAVHFASRHMSWLHCMWGVGTIIGPNIMGFALTGGHTWNTGYMYVAIMQVFITIVLFVSLPLWKQKIGADDSYSEEEKNKEKPVSLLTVIKIKGAKEVMLAFFCYCGLEQTAMLWAGSYMVLHSGMSEEKAASCASVLFIGLTVGRLLNGFLTFKFTDTQMIRVGQCLIVLGAIVLLLSPAQAVSMIGLVIVGLGCAPIYPCIIHSTPVHFGVDKSQAMIGIQMASAYVGTCLMPTLFGFIANALDVALMPIYLMILVAIMFFAHKRLVRVKEI